MLPWFAFCGRCGQPRGGSTRFPTDPVPPPSPAPRAGRILVIVLAILVLLPAVLAGVLYLTVSGLLPPAPPGPAVMLNAMNVSFAGATVRVSSIHPSTSPGFFYLNLVVGGMRGTPVSLGAPAGMPVSIPVGAQSYLVTWRNPSGSALVSAGDEFELAFPSGPNAPPPGTSITFLLIWEDGSLIADTIFSTPSERPFVTFSPTRIPGGVDALVTEMFPMYAPSNYRVNLENATSMDYGRATYMPAASGTSISVVVGQGADPTTFSVIWQNPSGNGLVSQGDHFIITKTAGAYASGTTFSFLLIWIDGATTAVANWAV